MKHVFRNARLEQEYRLTYFAGPERFVSRGEDVDDSEPDPFGPDIEEGESRYPAPPGYEDAPFAPARPREDEEERRERRREREHEEERDRDEERDAPFIGRLFDFIEGKRDRSSRSGSESGSESESRSDAESRSGDDVNLNIAEGGRSENNIRIRIGDDNERQPRRPGEDSALLREKAQGFSAAFLRKFGARMKVLNIPKRYQPYVEQFKQAQAAKINAELRAADSGYRVAVGPVGTGLLIPYSIEGDERAPAVESLSAKQQSRVIEMYRQANNQRMRRMPMQARVEKLNAELGKYDILTMHFAEPLPGFTEVRLIDGPAPSFS